MGESQIPVEHPHPLAVVNVFGRLYRVEPTTCAGCGRKVLIVASDEHKHSALYNWLTLTPDGPQGDRHVCPGPAPGPG